MSIQISHDQCYERAPKASPQGWEEHVTRAWHPQALHQAFRPPFVHLFSLVLESSFNEYRLPCTAVTLF